MRSVRNSLDRAHAGAILCLIICACGGAPPTDLGRMTSPGEPTAARTRHAARGKRLGVPGLAFPGPERVRRTARELPPFTCRVVLHASSLS
jgi:hypothetical protein